MPRYRFDPDAAPDWVPLERLCRLCGASPDLPPLDADQFMYMGRVCADRRPPIHLYKHVGARRYVNLDDAGHAFQVQWHRERAAASTGGGFASCRAHPDLLSALC